MGKYALRFVAIGYVSALLLVPLAIVFKRAFADGFGPAWDAVTRPQALHAFWLTILIALIAVPANTIFGVAVRARGRPPAVPGPRAA